MSDTVSHCGFISEGNLRLLMNKEELFESYQVLKPLITSQNVINFDVIR